MPGFKDLTGMKFGRLTVIGLDSKKEVGGRTRYYWLCQCDCGKKHVARTDGLTGGGVQSCGCLHRETAIEHVSKHHKHKLSNTSIYKKWQNMKKRCLNPNDKHYPRWGGRGIAIYPAWIDDFQAFYDYVSKLDHFGEEGYSLDRIDNNGNYEPDNLRWADINTQCRNRRSNIIIEYEGEQMTLIEAAEKSGVAYKVLNSRIQYGNTEKEFFRPSGENAKYIVEIDGQKLTFKEIAEKAGISLATVYQRYRAGKRGKELLKSSQHRDNQSDSERLIDIVEHRE